MNPHLYDWIVGASTPVFVAFIVIEVLVATRTGRDVYERRDAVSSISIGIISLLFSAGAHLILGALLVGLYNFRLWTLPDNLWTLAAGFIVVDFLFYWGHRAHHEVRMGWAAHVVHHSSERYNFSTALRQSWSEPFTLIPFFLPLSLLGFPPGTWFICFALNLVYQFFTHTELVGRLGPLEWVFNTPSHHRVHHGSNLNYLDKNYAGVFIIWDRIFGTFEPEKEAVEYGLVSNINTFNVFTANVHEWRDMVRDGWRSGSPMTALAYAFKPPGWRPGPDSSTVADLRAAAANNAGSGTATHTMTQAVIAPSADEAATS